MKVFLSKVDDVFQLTGRGCVVVPGIPESWDKKVIKVGDAIILKRPDMPEICTVVQGLEMGARTTPKITPLLLGDGVSKEMVPIGTELWV